MSESCFLGIDVGTSGAKALLLDEAGAVIADAFTPYLLSTPRPLWAEQTPEDWWNSTVASIQVVIEHAGIAPKQIAGVGLTGQMHGLVMLDESSRVLRPAILWNDQRTAAQCEWMHERIGAETLINLTGKPALSGFTAPKILWVREH